MAIDFRVLPLCTHRVFKTVLATTPRTASELAGGCGTPRLRKSRKSSWQGEIPRGPLSDSSSPRFMVLKLQFKPGLPLNFSTRVIHLSMSPISEERFSKSPDGHERRFTVGSSGGAGTRRMAAEEKLLPLEAATS